MAHPFQLSHSAIVVRSNDDVVGEAVASLFATWRLSRPKVCDD